LVINMRAMSEAQKKLRAWFRRHKWQTGNTPTDQGFWMVSPVENKAGYMEHALDTKTGKIEEYSEERRMTLELDRFTCDYVTFELEKRKHWWRRDKYIAEDNHFGYTHVPSDDFSDWESAGYINIPAEDILKLAELIKVAQKEWLDSRPSKNHLNYMEGIAKQCGPKWIGRNTTYDEIKWAYSNERLRQEGKKI